MTLDICVLNEIPYFQKILTNSASRHECTDWLLHKTKYSTMNERHEKNYNIEYRLIDF